MTRKNGFLPSAFAALPLNTRVKIKAGSKVVGTGRVVRHYGQNFRTASFIVLPEDGGSVPAQALGKDGTMRFGAEWAQGRGRAAEFAIEKLEEAPKGDESAVSDYARNMLAIVRQNPGRSLKWYREFAAIAKVSDKRAAESLEELIGADLIREAEEGLWEPVAEAVLTERGQSKGVEAAEGIFVLEAEAAMPAPKNPSAPTPGFELFETRRFQSLEDLPKNPSSLEAAFDRASGALVAGGWPHVYVVQVFGGYAWQTGTPQLAHGRVRFEDGKLLWEFLRPSPKKGCESPEWAARREAFRILREAGGGPVLCGDLLDAMGKVSPELVRHIRAAILRAAGEQGFLVSVGASWALPESFSDAAARSPQRLPSGGPAARILSVGPGLAGVGSP